MFFVFFMITGVFSVIRYLPVYLSGLKLSVTHCAALTLLPRTLFPISFFLLPAFIFCILIFGFVRAIKKNLFRSKENRKFLCGLPIVIGSSSSKLTSIIKELQLKDKIRIFQCDDILYAFSTGYFKSEIYLSTGLVDRLSENELNAVLLHEKHHIKHKDNIKLSAILFMKDWFFFIPVFKTLSMLFHELIERKADKKVVKTLGKPLELARLLLRMSETNNKIILEEPALSIVGHNCIESRIRFLVNNEETVFLPDLKTIGISIFIGSMLIVLFFSRAIVPEKGSFTKFENSINIICDENKEESVGHHYDIEKDYYLTNNSLMIK